MKTSLPQKRRWRHAIWLGPVISLVGFLSYFLYLYRFPILRDFPWINLPLVIIGALLAVAGLVTTWRTSGKARKGFSIISTLFSVAMLLLFSFYIFVLSSQMPAAENARFAETVPDVALENALGGTINLTQLPVGRKGLISFYRGFW